MRRTARYLLDTNVLSELVKPHPDQAVVAWVDARPPLDLAISVLTLGEVHKGIGRIADGHRRAALSRWARTELPTQFVGRLLVVDEKVAVAWGLLSGSATREGRPLPVVDGLLLATAQVHELTLVTRNVADCAARGVPVFDPWHGKLHG
jgi:predicted nucleic acid-binding protein